MTIIIYFNNINYCYYYSSIKSINEKKIQFLIIYIYAILKLKT